MCGKWIVREEGGTLRLETEERKPTLREHGEIEGCFIRILEAQEGAQPRDITKVNFDYRQWLR